MGHGMIQNSRLVNINVEALPMIVLGAWKGDDDAMPE